MLLVVQKGREQEIIDMFHAHDVDAVAIGKVIETENFRVLHHGGVVADVPIKTLVDDAPVYHLPAVKPADIDQKRSQLIPKISDYTVTFRKVVSHPTVESKAYIYDQYDASGALIGPGPDAGVISISDTKSIAMTTDGNSRYIHLDPETGGKIAVAEAAR